MSRIITCEQVSDGHPDKICDQIADAIVTDCLAHDKHSRVAIECLFKDNHLIIAGELTSKHRPDYAGLVYGVLRRIGYEDAYLEPFPGNLDIGIMVREQSPDIALGVDKGGAGDQGIMYGYATNETPEMLPLPFVLATKFLKVLKNHPSKMFKPDAKAQVSFDYDTGRITTFLCSVQHSPDVEVNDFRHIIESLMVLVASEYGLNGDFEKLINPTGKFVIGGPTADCGVTGRKLACDTYGGVGRIGGGALSGKDPTKVDRSAAYAARKIARDIVRAGYADKCEVSIPNFNNQPPKHLITYTDFAAEFISWTCNRQSGAVGIPSFLIYSFWFWKKDIETGYCQKDAEYYRDQEFQRIIYKLNQPFLRGGIQSAFTNFTIFDRDYLISLFGGRAYPDGTPVVDYVDEIMEYQKAFMEALGKIREVNMMTFPVITFALLRKDGRFVDENFAKWCCRHNMKWADANFYISDDVTSLSNCCRLVSDIKTLGFFNSIGGTALEVGSVKVNTVNLARLAYEHDREDYIRALKEQVLLCLKALDSVRHIIARNVEKGLLPNYSLGVINLSSQYNTVGIIGLYEALQKFGYTETDAFGYTRYTAAGLIFAKKILKAIHEVKDAFSADYLINIEQIPGERAAHILMQKDMVFFPNESYELPLYGNQWIPLGIKTTIQDKVQLSAELDKACNGGSIAHINLDKPFDDFDMAWKVLNYVADSGVVYFAFNVRISACDNNHGFYGEICPVCGGKKTTSYQRIVGFLTPEKTYSKPRKGEFALRDWFDLSVMGDLDG